MNRQPSFHTLTNKFTWFCDQVTGQTFEVETDTFKLRNIMEAPLLKYKEEIEVRMNSKLSYSRQNRYEKHLYLYNQYSGW